MRKILFLVIAFFGYATVLHAQNEPISNLVLKSNVLDYGTITHGADPYRSLEFKNAGNAPLTLQKVTSTCGCLVPMYREAAIYPGEIGTIKLRYDTQRLGKFSKAIKIVSTDGQEVIVTVKGEVLPKSSEAPIPIRQGQ